MKNKSQQWLVGLAIVIAFWLVWSRLRIHVLVRLSGLQSLLVFAVLVLGIFLVLEHIVNRTR